jgi:hypothetical protein
MATITVVFGIIYSRINYCGLTGCCGLELGLSLGHQALGLESLRALASTTSLYKLYVEIVSKLLTNC